MEVSVDLFLSRARDMITKAVKEWVVVDLIEHYSLTGGVSGASIYYVRAKLSFPGVPREPLEKIDFVIKFSGRRTFDVELENYNALHEDHKKYFLNFAATRTQIHEHFYMVMEYLEGYETLESLLYDVHLKTSPADSIRNVIKVLRSIQTEHLPDPVQGSLASRAFRLYFGQLDKDISEAMRVHNDLLSELYGKVLVVNNKPLASLKASFEKVCKHAISFAPPTLARIHGDCHARNIVVNPNIPAGVKFLDIDNLDQEGDYIYDFGELFADLETFGYILGARQFNVKEYEKNGAVCYDYKVDPPQAVREALNQVKQELDDLTGDDSNWENRFKLAKARYLFNMVSKIQKYDQDKIVAFYLEGTKIMDDLASRLQ